MIEPLRAARTLLIDTNLLVLYIVGLLGSEWIDIHKRTANYSVEDFILLSAIIDSKTRLVTTPQILSEVSNLSRQVREPLRSQLSTVLLRLLQVLDERYVESSSAAKSPCFQRLGLTDAAIVALCGEGLLLLTDDLDLYLEVGRAGGRAFNFNHLRTSAWGLS
jgi:hypothetical protein